MGNGYGALSWFQSTPDLINRENSIAGINSDRATKFQSTPDLINRENIFYRCCWWRLLLFQSTPDLINRENLLCALFVKHFRPVSIHSRFN